MTTTSSVFEAVVSGLREAAKEHDLGHAIAVISQLGFTEQEPVLPNALKTWSVDIEDTKITVEYSFKDTSKTSDLRPDLNIFRIRVVGGACAEQSKDVRFLNLK